MNEFPEELSVAERRDLAMREVLGLLEPEEEARLGRSFDSLSPQDQAEILDLQAAIASQIGGLGEDLPDRALRYQVLARLAEEIDQENLDVSPIASIGSRLQRHGGSEDDNGSGPIGGAARFTAERGVRSARVWRAATIAFAAAFLAVLVFQRSTQVQVDQIVAMLDTAINQEQFRKDVNELLGGGAMAESDRSLLPLLESPTVDRYALTCPETGEIGALLFTGREGPDSGVTICVLSNQAATRDFDLVGVTGGSATTLASGIPNRLLAMDSDSVTSRDFDAFESLELRDAQTGRTIFTFVRQA